jgi:hypothetical protein
VPGYFHDLPAVCLVRYAFTTGVSTAKQKSDDVLLTTSSRTPRISFICQQIIDVHDKDK